MTAVRYATVPVTGSAQVEYLRIQQRHEQTIRDAQIAAVARWPLADQVRLMRQIAQHISEEATFCLGARHEAMLAVDQADEIKRLLIDGEDDNLATGLVPVTARGA